MNEKATKWCEEIESNRDFVGDDTICVMQELRRLEAENTALTIENAGAVKQLEDAYKKIGELKTELGKADEAAEYLGAMLDAVRQHRDALLLELDITKKMKIAQREANSIVATAPAPSSPPFSFLTNAELSDAIAQTFDLRSRCWQNSAEMTRTMAHYDRLLTERERRAENRAAPARNDGYVTTTRNPSFADSGSVPCAGTPCVEDK